MKKILLVVMILAVYALHQDFWFWREYKPLIFGFIPVGLAYHAGYSILCAITMAVLVKFAWPGDLEHVEPASEGGRDARPTTATSANSANNEAGQK